jgi:hypothetical protein
LDVGDPGMFDDCGVAAVCVLPVGRELWMYYIGFQRSLRVPYHIFTGLATSRDCGETFHRVKRVPILDRTDFGALLRSSPFVMPPEGTSSIWRMWYSAGSSPRSATTGWVPSYSLYYAESPNGIDWTGPDTPILSPTGAGEYGLGKPWVRRLDTGLEMFYSVRSEPLGYRIGYATMVDGQTWVRRDEAAEIDVSPSGWDSDMIAFPALCASQSGTYMFYNGNGIGMTGFGAALEVLQP